MLDITRATIRWKRNRPNGFELAIAHPTGAMMRAYKVYLRGYRAKGEIEKLIADCDSFRQGQATQTEALRMLAAVVFLEQAGAFEPDENNGVAWIVQASRPRSMKVDRVVSGSRMHATF